MLIDLTRRAPLLRTHECVRSVTVRLCTVKDIATAYVVGHKVVEPAHVMTKDNISMADFCLSIEPGANEQTNIGPTFRYRIVTARRSDRDYNTWQYDEVQVEILRDMNDVWYVTVFRGDHELVRACTYGLIPGLVENGVPEETGSKSVWERLLDDPV